jgi:hypothetical protein
MVCGPALLDFLCFSLWKYARPAALLVSLAFAHPWPWFPELWNTGENRGNEHSGDFEPQPDYDSRTGHDSDLPVYIP